jgi:hypothetical protein
VRSRHPLSDSSRRGQHVAHTISSTLVAVKSASERGRAESIRDVVDAYRRLYGSVQRFVLMLSDAQLNFASVGTSGSPSLNQLLSILADRARAASFTRLPDLKAAIEDARPADQLRDAIFADASSNDVPALRKVVAELDRLDAAFVGLCVGHVLEQHARADGGDVANAVKKAARRGARVAGNEANVASGAVNAKVATKADGTARARANTAASNPARAKANANAAAGIERAGISSVGGTSRARADAAASTAARRRKAAHAEPELAHLPD